MLKHCAHSQVCCTWADVEFEVLSDGADGGEVGGIIEMFLQRLGRNLTEFIFHGFSNAHRVHGDTCVRAQKHAFNVSVKGESIRPLD